MVVSASSAEAALASGILANITSQLVRSTSVATAERLPAPLIRSASSVREPGGPLHQAGAREC